MTQTYIVGFGCIKESDTDMVVDLPGLQLSFMAYFE